MELVKYRRQFAERVRNDKNRDVMDTLQGVATMIYASLEAYKVKNDGASFQAVKSGHP